LPRIVPSVIFLHVENLEKPSVSSHVRLGRLDVDSLRPEVDPSTGIDLSLIDENLKRTPWERILANDSALNLCEMLQAAMKQHDEGTGANSRAVGQS
jgi:hypothetical protein